MKKTFRIIPTEHYEAVVVGEQPQSLVSINVWPGHHGASVTLEFETSEGEEPYDNSRFTVCVADAGALIDAIRKAIE